jgi:hypothetical protein
MTRTNDPFLGTWKLSPAHSRFDPNHRPREATMRFERDEAGAYLMTAEGVSERGEPVVERPQRMMPDGEPYPIAGFPGLVTVTTLPAPRTLHTEARREDGSVAGGGTMIVSEDGRALTATNFGFDSQLREFRQETVWMRAQ